MLPNLLKIKILNFKTSLYRHSVFGGFFYNFESFSSCFGYIYSRTRVNTSVRSQWRRLNRKTFM